MSDLEKFKKDSEKYKKELEKLKKDLVLRRKEHGLSETPQPREKQQESTIFDSEEIERPAKKQVFYKPVAKENQTNNLLSNLVNKNQTSKFHIQKILPLVNVNDGCSLNREIHRELKKLGRSDNGKSLYWMPSKDLRSFTFLLGDWNKALSDRSEIVFDYLNSVKPNKFQKGCFPINLREIEIICKSFNRYQRTEAYISYFKLILHFKTKIDFIRNRKSNYMDHFGSNNSYFKKGMTTKKNLFLQKIMSRLKALKWVALEGIKQLIHRSGKRYYKLTFQSVNKYSRSLSDKLKGEALAYLNSFRGREPPSIFYLLGL